MSEQHNGPTYNPTIPLTVCGKDYSKKWLDIPEHNRYAMVCRHMQTRMYGAEPASIVGKYLAKDVLKTDAKGDALKEQLAAWREVNPDQYKSLMFAEADKQDHYVLHEEVTFGERGPRLDPVEKEYGELLDKTIKVMLVSMLGKDAKMPTNDTDLVVYPDGTTRTRAQLRELAPRVTAEQYTDGFANVGERLMQKARDNVAAREIKAAKVEPDAPKVSPTAIGM